jgi:hypothetical protein
MTKQALVPVGPVQSPYRPLSKAEVRVNRALRDRIVEYLAQRKGEVDAKCRAIPKSEPRFCIDIPYDLGEKIFPREKVADIVRCWVWREFQGKIGLDRYETAFGGSRIWFCR